jgi:hypothetical protein
VALQLRPRHRRLLRSDIGQNLYEEIDLITKGGNYGWRMREATHAFQGGELRKDFVDPIIEIRPRQGAVRYG